MPKLYYKPGKLKTPYERRKIYASVVEIWMDPNIPNRPTKVIHYSKHWGAPPPIEDVFEDTLSGILNEYIYECIQISKEEAEHLIKHSMLMGL